MGKKVGGGLGIELMAFENHALTEFVHIWGGFQKGSGRFLVSGFVQGIENEELDKGYYKKLCFRCTY